VRRCRGPSQRTRAGMHGQHACRAVDAPAAPAQDGFLEARPAKMRRTGGRELRAGAGTPEAAAAAHARLIAVLQMAAAADAASALSATHELFEWLDGADTLRAAAVAQPQFLPPVEWLAALSRCAAACGEAGAGPHAWQLVTDMVYHDSFGLLAWSPSSLQARHMHACHALLARAAAGRRCVWLQACHEILSLQWRLADWCCRQQPGGLRGGASQGEVGLLGELQALAEVVPRRCQAVATELLGADLSFKCRRMHACMHALWACANWAMLDDAREMLTPERPLA
jgi:hypothetical protein